MFTDRLRTYRGGSLGGGQSTLSEIGDQGSHRVGNFLAAAIAHRQRNRNKIIFLGCGRRRVDRSQQSRRQDVPSADRSHPHATAAR